MRNPLLIVFALSMSAGAGCMFEKKEVRRDARLVASDRDASIEADGGGCIITGDPNSSGDVRSNTDGSGDCAGDSYDLGDSSEYLGDDGGDSSPGDDERGDDNVGDPLTSCPPEMASIGGFCIDRYEASRQDATFDQIGTDNTIATSRSHVMPWYVDTMTQAAFELFSIACANAGKRLCHKDEWFDACAGPVATTYVYGDTFNSQTCNCVDTFCDDYCVENDISSALCNTSSDCGYHCGAVSPPTNTQCFHVAPTASFADCTNDYGTFDINGNVWEIVPSTTDIRGFEVRGGAFNCAAAYLRLQCAYNAGWSQLYAGFRCCKDR